MNERIRLPDLPEPAEKPSFPVVASAAPVAGALVMWAFTQSPLALVFAFLGPLVAVGGLVDSRRRERKRSAEAHLRHTREVQLLRERIARAHEDERRQLARDVATALDPLVQGQVTRDRWRRAAGDSLSVALGVGTIASCVEVDSSDVDVDVDGSPARGDGKLDAQRAELASFARVIQSAPVLVDARHGIGVVRGSPGAQSLVRAIIVQLAHSLGPDLATFRATHPRDHAWLREFPHVDGSDEPATIRKGATSASIIDVLALDGRPLALVAVASSEAELPHECRVVVAVRGAALDIVRWNEPAKAPTSVRPHLVSREFASRLALQLHDAAKADGVILHDAVPPLVTSAELEAHTLPSGADSLDCVFGLGAAGTPIRIDLVTDGPHALVGGTTGSGKSELLCAWVLAMATARSPLELTVLLVDFKGGASFRVIESLPHCVGTVTDLDPAEAERALTSLRAELRYRERVLAESSARDISELAQGVLPRLVIVVDEYAALVSDHPTLHSVFADIAARGRSLGVHLILSTQRPAGVVRDAVFANAPIRVSLRVLDPAESVAVIGAPDAAKLRADQPGRALVSFSSSTITPVQPALVTAQDVDAVRTRWRSGATELSSHRPWLPPLPQKVLPEQLDGIDATGPGLRFGLIDRPEEQRRLVATFEPRYHGHLFVVGGRGSGRTTALAALASAARESDEPGGTSSPPTTIVVVPSDVEGAWDTVHDAVHAVRTGRIEPRLYLLDDVDTVCSRMPDDYRDTFVRSLCALLQEGPSAGAYVVMTSSRVGAAVSPLAALCESRLVLRMSDRHEHSVAGADPARFSAELPPGRGWFRGDLVHIVGSEFPDPLVLAPRAESVDLERGPLLIVAARPADMARRLDRVWGRGTTEVLGGARAPTTNALTISEVEASGRVIVGDPETWQSRWALFTELSRAVPVAFHECSLAQFRQLSGTRDVPPPLAAQAGSVWLSSTPGTVVRAQLPGAGSGVHPAKGPLAPPETMDSE